MTRTTQSETYLITYQQALGLLLARAADMTQAVTEASALAAQAAALAPKDEEPPRRGPGRPPKDVKND